MVRILTLGRLAQLDRALGFEPRGQEFESLTAHIPSRYWRCDIPMGEFRMPQKSVQETFAPHNACFGCGPSNPKGLRIRSFPEGDTLVAEWTSETHHEAFPGMLNGGIIGALLDCHSNWTAAYFLMKRAGVETPPCTVTAEFSVKLLRPTPTNGPVKLVARVKEIQDDRAWIHAELIAGGKVCDTCVGLFVAVKPGHPAYHRW